ncbi:transposase [Gimesia benthica]|uniref:Transposase n=1 Tax=Gimesia benthica TaxID=2608982 RepID=A0A6I6ADM5_9PLAN|nr:transposase [Gimesia benthica]
MRLRGQGQTDRLHNSWDCYPNRTPQGSENPCSFAFQLVQVFEAGQYHSDRGSQYCSEEYQRTLKINGIQCSMSRKGDCWDNAVMESFFATLKKELIHRQKYETRASARHSIFEYIEVFYNRERLHSSLDYLSPEMFEQAV